MARRYLETTDSPASFSPLPPLYQRNNRLVGPALAAPYLVAAQVAKNVTVRPPSPGSRKSSGGLASTFLPAHFVGSPPWPWPIPKAFTRLIGLIC